MSASRIVRAALVGGAIAGTLDILGATALLLADGEPVLTAVQGVASGVLDREAYQMGARSALLGLAIHFCIATTMATAYMIVASRWSWLTRRPLLWGPIYGLLMYGVMHFGVLAIRWPHVFPRFDWARDRGQVACHLFLVGLPIALVAWRMLKRRDDAR